MPTVCVAFLPLFTACLLNCENQEILIRHTTNKTNKTNNTNNTHKTINTINTI